MSVTRSVIHPLCLAVTLRIHRPGSSRDLSSVHIASAVNATRGNVLTSLTMTNTVRNDETHIGPIASNKGEWQIMWVAYYLCIFTNLFHKAIYNSPNNMSA